jgi:GT2 family glycosyltransferase
MPDAPKVVALIATRFRSDLLTRLLESLHHQSIHPLAAVICDNGPDPTTLETAKNSPLPCELVSPGKNLGFGGGLAAAGQLAFEKFPDLSHLLIMDDDAILAPKDLESLLTSATKHSAGTVAPFLVDQTGKLQEVPEPVSWSLARAFRAVGQNLDQARALAPPGYPMAWCIGPCLLITKETWLRAGPPRSDMLAFGDDVEFSLRLSAASPAWAEPSVTVIHAPPTASSSPSVGPRSAGAKNPKLSAQSLESPPPVAPRPPSEAAPPQWSAAKEGLAASSPPNAAHYRKFGILLQNLAFTCVISPRPRHLPLYLPGNARRFLRTFGFTPANFFEVLRRYLKGFLGIPGGR